MENKLITIIYPVYNEENSIPNILSGVAHSKILDCVSITVCEPKIWEAPEEYVIKNTSSTVTKIIFAV